MSIEKIFDGDDIKVGLFDNKQNDNTIVITFSPIMNTNALMNNKSWNGYRNGFGETFLKKHNITAFFVVATSNHWWEVEESKYVIEVIKNHDFYKNASKIILYGSSMGGYGTMLFSNRLNATDIVSIVPQVFVDSKNGSFDSRWMRFRKKLDFIYNDILEQINKFSGNAYIIYDPLFNNDNLHINLLPKKKNISLIKIEGSKHTPLVYLNSVKLLDKFILNLFLNKSVDTIVNDAKTKVAQNGVTLYLDIKKAIKKSNTLTIFDNLAKIFEENDLSLKLHLLELSKNNKKEIKD